MDILSALKTEKFTQIDDCFSLWEIIFSLKKRSPEELNLVRSVMNKMERMYFSLDSFSIDKIAIPDFGTGAMENWGLITYRETNLLYDPNESASSNQQRVATVVAHELVHQV